MRCYLVLTGLGSIWGNFLLKSGKFLPKSSGHTASDGRSNHHIEHNRDFGFQDADKNSKGSQNPKR